MGVGVSAFLVLMAVFWLQRKYSVTCHFNLAQEDVVHLYSNKSNDKLAVNNLEKLLY